MAYRPPYFSLWGTPPENGVGLLEQALKKSGWRGPTKTGAQRQNEFLQH